MSQSNWRFRTGGSVLDEGSGSQGRRAAGVVTGVAQPDTAPRLPMDALDMKDVALIENQAT
jgi:hypothetical protein